MLAHATNTLCVDEPDYEKAQKTLAQYANFQRFKERVLSEVPLKRAKWVKEMPRATIFREMPSYEQSISKERGRPKFNLFKETF